MESSEPLQLKDLRATLSSPEAPISCVNVGREGSCGKDHSWPYSHPTSCDKGIRRMEGKEALHIFISYRRGNVRCGK